MTHPSPRAAGDPARPRGSPPAPVAWRLLALLASLAAGGCLLPGGAPSPGPIATIGGGRPPTADRTIPLELTFVRCDADDPLLRDEFWQFVDEQAIPTDVRGRLAANGLRVGVVGVHLPSHLAARFSAASSDGPASGALPTDAAVSRRLVRLLPGRRGEIVAAARVRELVLLEHAGGGVRGGSYHDASPLFAVEARPAANGHVHLQVRPEIRHGPLEKSWVGEAGMFRLETGQRRHRLEHLDFDLVLPRDGTLVLGCRGGDTVTAGDCLLRDHDRGGGAVRLLAIRPLSDAVDPLFQPDDEADAADDEAGDAPLVVR